MNVQTVNAWEKDGKTRWYVHFEDGSDAVCFSPQAADLKPGPLPDGWELDPPKEPGWKPMLRAPKKAGGGGGGGGPAAWRNTEAGFRFEQGQMNRRTALMQAVEISRNFDGDWPIFAEPMYEWLQAAGEPASPPPRDASPAPSSSQAPVSGHGEVPDGDVGPQPEPAEDEWTLCSGDKLLEALAPYDGDETRLLNGIRKLTKRNTMKAEVTDAHLKEVLRAHGKRPA